MCGDRCWGSLTNVQCKAIGNWQDKYPLHNDYVNKNENEEHILALS
jgi:hypothetical protein